MRLLFRAMGRYKRAVAACVFIKLIGTLSELLLPYILEHMIDKVAPLGDLRLAVLWGLLMFAAAVVCRQLNVIANRRGIETAHQVSFDIRQELFRKTANLSGSQFDTFGLPSLISRMTSDSYNVQSAVMQLQTLCVRAPFLLIGGVCVSLAMDAALAMILIAMLPVLILVVLVVSARGLPMYNRVQRRLDLVVRVMRENITGIRVVKALSKTEYETRRFAQANQDLADSDIAAGTVMAIPSPFMQLCLNGGLSLVVFIGAGRVNAGNMEPGVILAFLTYFNMITMGVMGLSRIFMTLSRAGASADRIDQVLQAETDQRVLSETEALTPAGDGFIRFEHVNFSYGEEPADSAGFAGEKRENALTDISFALNRGESLGIIGPTGCGKSTIISLLMRFYDVGDGGVFVDGKDVRAYDKDALRRRFGVCFQNDMVFQDTLRENVRFGRDVDGAAFRAAIEDAMAAEYIDALEDGPDNQAAIKGANLSGGQRQRLLVARTLAAKLEILILDDSSSALDYRTDAAMRRDVFNKLMTLPVGYFDRNQAGDIISRVSYDVDVVCTSLSTNVIQIVTSTVTVVGSFLMMCAISIPLVLCMAATIPASILFTRRMGKKTRPLYARRSAAYGTMNGFAEEMFTGQRTILAYAQEDRVCGDFSRINRAAAEAYRDADGLGMTMGPTVGMISNFGLAAIGLGGCVLYMLNVVGLKQISSFVLYSRKFSGPINEISNIINEIFSALAASERVFRLLDEPEEVKDIYNAAELENCRGQVKAEDVAFGYEPGRTVLHHLDFEAKPGQTVAIVGPTGAGKTTIINLLMRFYDPDRGCIYVDGRENRTYTMDSLRRSYAMVLQETWVFRGTIFDNIAYGKEDAALEEVVAAAKAARIHSYIMRLPQGYNTVVSEDGGNISKGQKQLLTIARAMLYNTHMLILDEATSNVDTNTERQVQRAIRSLMAGKTCFVIAHRLSTIQNADHILVVDHGDVVEQGTHEELMARKGFYFRLYASQFG